MAGSLARIVLASAAMGAAAMSAETWLTVWLPGDAIGWQVARVAATIGVALAVLAAAAWALRIREFNDGTAIVLRRFRRTDR
jgi:peptidoglycan biosynthesis protein MviN/MurJ (putative lipid II flippase)